MRARPLLPVLLVALGCVSADDNPSSVRDVRVLGVRLDPPELMADSCETDAAAGALPLLAAPLRLSALVVDPAGGGRPLEYTLQACGSTTRALCKEDAVLLAEGAGATGPLVLQLEPGPGAVQLPDGTPLVQRVVELDTFRGLGGVRLPLVLRVRVGAEEVSAQKLMVYSCRRFPEMQPNLQPELPGLLLEGRPWGEGELPQLRGRGPFRLEPQDFAHLEERYTVPSFELTPVHLEEKWELAWHTSLGTVSPTETGGADVGGEVGRHPVEWQPPEGAPAQDVRFWVTVRDGRGGLSWLERRLRYTP